MKTATKTPFQDYLVFHIAQRQYGIALSKVQELRSHEAVCALPEGGVVAGTIRLQGFDVPVLRLDALLDADIAPPRHGAEVVVINSAARVVALAVDGVVDVVTVAQEQLRTAPDMRSADEDKHLAGVAILGQRVVMLLDIDRMIFNLQARRAERLAA